MGTPVLTASCRIDREYIELRREDKGAVYLDQSAVEPRIFTGVVGAQNLQAWLRSIVLISLSCEKRSEVRVLL